MATIEGSGIVNGKWDTQMELEDKLNLFLDELFDSGALNDIPTLFAQLKEKHKNFEVSPITPLWVAISLTDKISHLQQPHEDQEKIYNGIVKYSITLGINPPSNVYSVDSKRLEACGCIDQFLEMPIPKKG